MGAFVQDGRIEPRGNLRGKAVTGGFEIEDQAAEEPENEAQSAGDAARYQHAGADLLLFYLAGEDVAQRQESQQRHRDLGHNQDGRDRAELVVEREPVEEEARKPHPVVSPGQKDGKEGGYQERPFVGAADQQQSQDEEEADDGARIDVSGREGLFAPVHRRVAAESLGIGGPHAVLDHGLAEVGVAARVVGGCTAHKARNQQREGLGPAVAPLGGVIEVQAARFVAFVGFLDQVGMAAAHGFAGIFRIGEDAGRVGADSDSHRSGEQEGGHEEVLVTLLAEMGDEFGEPAEPDHHEDVVGHLRVDGVPDGGENHGQDKPEAIFLAMENQVEGGEDHAHQGNRGGLPVVPGRNDDDKVRRQGDGDGPGDTGPGVDFKGAQQDEKTEEIDQEHPDGMRMAAEENGVQRRQKAG